LDHLPHREDDIGGYTPRAIVPEHYPGLVEVHRKNRGQLMETLVYTRCKALSTFLDSAKGQRETAPSALPFE